jgi:hypothetical protein
MDLLLDISLAVVVQQLAELGAEDGGEDEVFKLAFRFF